MSLPVFLPGRTVADAYQEANLPVARQQLYQVRVRLAWMLNEVCPSCLSRQTPGSTP